jgi:zinc transporter
VENIEKMLDQLESDVAVGNIAELRATLSAVRRRAAAIRRHLAPQRVALDRLIQFPGSVLSDSETLKLREEGEHLTRYIEDLDLARENALVTQEEMLNRVAQEQNARMYVLSIVAAIFLPLSFVTGLLGMNVAGLPGTDDPNGFRISAAVMISLGVALIGFFKWRRWL